MRLNSRESKQGKSFDRIPRNISITFNQGDQIESEAYIDDSDYFVDDQNDYGLNKIDLRDFNSKFVKIGKVPAAASQTFKGQQLLNSQKQIRYQKEVGLK